ncbi:hypothetical protein [Mariniblastus fucicola]|uniref:Uncharacterized protein n=1 Tax=Mariniblastus fucicola TaxID=980251 RepID=A0A5B9PHS2_9BACT|nr:hypothetical protein [Mariniblastus fucicola]QEG24835.1 hypothetical protein MFFC18_47580 [Mariniblastus fucicola]
MPSFSRSGEFYGASLITGPSSALVRVRFSPEHVGPPIVNVLAADARFGNPPDRDVASAVADAVQQANGDFDTRLIPAEIAYQCDNDGLCYLIRRCAYIIVRRIAEVGDDEFIGVA